MARLQKILDVMEKREMLFKYTEEDGLGSLDFQFRGVKYHIWEFKEGDTYGVETNVWNSGRSEDVLDDYEDKIAALIESWPIMSIPG